MGRSKQPSRSANEQDQENLRKLVEGLLLEDDSLTRHQVVVRIYGNHITSRDLDRALALGQEQGLIVVAKGYVEYQVRRRRTLITATEAARELT